MRPPCQSDITIDPELAALRILDVAASASISVLMVFHPSVCEQASDLDRAHLLANRIIDQAHRLRRALADYQHEIHLQRGPIDATDDLPW